MFDWKLEDIRPIAIIILDLCLLLSFLAMSGLVLLVNAVFDRQRLELLFFM